MGYKKLVKCGSCGFGNREGDEYCLFCQAPLTKAAAAKPRRRRGARQGRGGGEQGSAKGPAKTPVMPTRARPQRRSPIDPSRRVTAKRRSLSDLTGGEPRPVNRAKVTRVPSDAEVLIPRPEPSETPDADATDGPYPALSGASGPSSPPTRSEPPPTELMRPVAPSPDPAKPPEGSAPESNPWMSHLESKDETSEEPGVGQAWGGPSTVMSDSGSWRKKTDMSVPAASLTNLTTDVETTPAPQRGEGSRRLVRGAGRLLCWLTCEQLDPIPVGYAREVRIGRHQENDLVLPHKEVSRFHAALRVDENEALKILDLGSSNGLMVNEEAAKERAVAINDVITIGPYRLQIRDKNDPSLSQAVEDDAEKTIATMATAHADGNAALSGNLVDTPLSELLQGMEFHQKTGVMTINCPQGVGRIAIREGRPHSAAVGELAGRAAMFAMLGFSGGTFTLVSTEPPEEQQISGTITGLLLEFSREADEEDKSGAGLAAADDLFSGSSDFGGATIVSAGPGDGDDSGGS